MFAIVLVSATVGRVFFGTVADGGKERSRIVAVAAPGWIAFTGGVLFALGLEVGIAVVIPAVVLFAFGGMGWNGVTMLAAGELGVPARVGQPVALVSMTLAISAAVTTPALGALAANAGWVTFWLLVSLLGMTGALVSSSISRARPVTR